MEKSAISALVESQRRFFESGKTLSVKFRTQMLKKLYSEVKAREKDIISALKADLGKSDYESFMCEVGMVLTEISYMLKHIKKFSKPKTVKTPLPLGIAGW